MSFFLAMAKRKAIGTRACWRRKWLKATVAVKTEHEETDHPNLTNGLLTMLVTE